MSKENRVIHIPFRAGTLHIVQADEDWTGLPEASGKGCIVVRTSPEDTKRSSALLSRGFVFHERLLRAEIHSGRQQPEAGFPALPKGVDIAAFQELTEEMYALGCSAFSHDRRFHLEHDFNPALAAEVLRGYFNRFSGQEGVLSFQARAGEKLLGFTVVVPDSEKPDSFENVLGATLPGIQGKMAAYPMYTFMLREMLRKGRAHYVGYVSAANLASLNLHVQLGAKWSGVFDEYILRTGETV